jgi:hypothetical protein
MPTNEGIHSHLDSPVWHLRPGDEVPALSQPVGTARSELRRRQLLRHSSWAGLAVLTAGGVAAAADS